MGYQNGSRGFKSRVFIEDHLTRQHGVGFGQPHPGCVGLFLGGEEGGLRGLEAALKLTILLSCLGVMVLGHPPLPEEVPGVIADVGVKGVP